MGGNKETKSTELTSKNPYTASTNVASAASTASTLGFASVPSDTSVEASMRGVAKPSRVVESSVQTLTNPQFCDRKAGSIPGRCLQHRAHLGEDMMLRLSHLRDRVDWLAQEMARIGETGGSGFSSQSTPSTSPAALVTQDVMRLV